MLTKIFQPALKALRIVRPGNEVTKALDALTSEVREVRAEVGEVRAEVGEVRAEVREVRAEVRAEVREVRAEVREVRAEVREVRAEVRAEIREVEASIGSLRKEVRSTASSIGDLLELACSGTINQQFGASLGARRVLRSAEEVAAVVSPEGLPIMPSINQLVTTLLRKELGVCHLASYGVRKVQELASGKNPTGAVVAAANELQTMGAHERLAAAAAAATRALEAFAAADGGGPGDAAAAAEAAAAAAAARVPEQACMAAVRQLHRSGVGSMLFAADMERYLSSSPEQRAELLAGRIFMPCLSAVATGTALPELELDRCGRVSLEDQLSGRIAVLHIGEIKMSRSSVRDARKQIVRSATTLAWAYHALRSGSGGGGGGDGSGGGSGGSGGRGGTTALPPVLDVRAHIFTSKDGHLHSRPVSRQLPAYHREERLPGHCCPLTVYLSYYTLTPSAAKRWVL